MDTPAYQRQRYVPFPQIHAAVQDFTKQPTRFPDVLNFFKWFSNPLLAPMALVWRISVPTRIRHLRYDPFRVITHHDRDPQRA